MSKNKETFTITAALPYANGPIHIGHLAGVYIPADIFATSEKIKYRSKGRSTQNFIAGNK